MMIPEETIAKESRPLVIGIGNAYRGDDAVGLIVVRRLQEHIGALAVCREEHGDGVALIEAWQDANAVILIDATHSGAAPGTLHRFDVQARRLPATLFCYSTHAFGVAEALELARALGQLPARCLVYGIEGKSFTAGVGLSPEVEDVLETVVQQIHQQLVLWRV